MTLKRFHIIFILLAFILLIIPFSGCEQIDNFFTSSSSSELSQISTDSSNSMSQATASIKVTSSSVTSSKTLTSSMPVSSSFTAQVSELCTTAQIKYNALNYDGAISECDKALSLDANCYIAYNIKGIALCFKQNYSIGMPLIERSLQINPDYAYGRFNMAMGYKLQKDLDNSLIWFNKALEVKPKDAWTFYGISTIYADKNDIPNSLKYLKMAVDLDSSVKPVAKRQDHFVKMRSNADFIKIVS
jgi:tetratricopeptide (TPR) repeat protein